MTQPTETSAAGAAFFDFDRTLFDGDAGVLFGAELLRIRWRRTLDEGRGTLGWLFRILGFVIRYGFLLLKSVVYRLAHRLFLLRRSDLVRLAYSALRGWPAEEVRFFARDYFDQVIAPRLYREAIEEVQRHRAVGRKVVVITTNMHFLIDHIKRHAPVDDVIAVHLNARQGILDGTVTGPLWGEEKAKAARDYAHAGNLSLPRSYAYSDHVSDAALLHLVGHPVVINPHLRFRLLARQRKWPIRNWKNQSVLAAPSPNP